MNDAATITTDTTLVALFNAGIKTYVEDTAGGCWCVFAMNPDESKPDVIIGPFTREGEPHDAGVYISRDIGGAEDPDDCFTVFTPEQAVEAVRKIL